MTKDEALKLALEALEVSRNTLNASRNWLQHKHDVTHDLAITAIREVLAQPDGCQCPACKVKPHASDCAVHNEPAYPKGACDCGAQPSKQN